MWGFCNAGRCLILTHTVCISITSSFSLPRIIPRFWLVDSCLFFRRWWIKLQRTFVYRVSYCINGFWFVLTTVQSRAAGCISPWAFHFPGEGSNSLMYPQLLLPGWPEEKLNPLSELLSHLCVDLSFLTGMVSCAPYLWSRGKKNQARDLRTSESKLFSVMCCQLAAARGRLLTLNDLNSSGPANKMFFQKTNLLR